MALVATGRGVALGVTGRGVALGATGRGVAIVATGRGVAIVATGRGVAIVATGRGVAIVATGRGSFGPAQNPIHRVGDKAPGVNFGADRQDFGGSFLAVISVHPAGNLDLAKARTRCRIIIRPDRQRVPGDRVKPAIAGIDRPLVGIGLADLKLKASALEVFVEALDRLDRGLVVCGGVAHARSSCSSHPPHCSAAKRSPCTALVPCAGGAHIHGPEAMGSCERAPRMCRCQWVNSVSEQAQSACPMGQPISHPTKSGFSRRRDRPFRIRRETACPPDSAMTCSFPSECRVKSSPMVRTSTGCSWGSGVRGWSRCHLGCG